MRKLTNKGLTKKLDDIIREKVRKRDKYTCQWCGKKVSGFDSQMSHTIPKGRCTYLRWDMQNVVLLCSFCHIEKWHKLSLGRKWFDAKYPKRVKYLEQHERKLVNKKKFMEELYKQYVDN
jgi:5-methylcytosine-specific restriction endonuclease McrA